MNPISIQEQTVHKIVTHRAELPAETVNPIATQQQMEQRTIERECTGDFTAHLEAHRKELQLTPEEAVARANENAEQDAQFVLRRPLQSIRFSDIEKVAKLNAQKGTELWEAIKREALDELRSGHRAAKAMQAGDSHPWQRARFLAIRQDLAEEWQPRNGIERQLLDSMALAQTGYFHWLEKLNTWTTLENWQDKQLAEKGQWAPPRIDDAKAIEQAATRVDQFNKIFLRSLRALRDLLRYGRPLIVQNAGQVNVGGQQMNVSTG